MLNVTVSPMTLCCTYLDSFFSSIPFLWSVAIKSVSGRDIRNCNSIARPANMRGSCKLRINLVIVIVIVKIISSTWCVIGISPKSLVAFVGPHSPLAQSGSGTITVCNSSQQIWRSKNVKIYLQYDTIPKGRHIFKSEGEGVPKTWQIVTYSISTVETACDRRRRNAHKRRPLWTVLMLVIYRFLLFI